MSIAELSPLEQHTLLPDRVRFLAAIRDAAERELSARDASDKPMFDSHSAKLLVRMERDRLNDLNTIARRMGVSTQTLSRAILSVTIECMESLLNQA